MTHRLVLVLEFDLFEPSVAVVCADNVEVVVLVVIEHDCCR